jgi:CheY-like chemotaxis protein
MKPDAGVGARILVVDDDAGQRSLLETFLRAQGFRTQSADSGTAALARMEEGDFGLIISDVRMPGMSGIETLRRVRERHPGLPVLLVTAFADIRSAAATSRKTDRVRGLCAITPSGSINGSSPGPAARSGPSARRTEFISSSRSIGLAR